MTSKAQDNREKPVSGLNRNDAPKTRAKTPQETGEKKRPVIARPAAHRDPLRRRALLRLLAVQYGRGPGGPYS
jgi:hypothetical protein